MKVPSDKIEVFCSRFIKEEFAKRFINESIKKPDKLYQRICSNEEIFNFRIQGVHKNIKNNEIFIGLYNTGFKFVSRSCIQRDIYFGGLVFPMEIDWFWMRTEPGFHLAGEDYHGHWPR